MNLFIILSFRQLLLYPSLQSFSTSRLILMFVPLITDLFHRIVILAAHDRISQLSAGRSSQLEHLRMAPDRADVLADDIAIKVQ